MASRHTSQRHGSTLTESPLFVTWNTVSPRSGTRSLRGCIGTFESLPLSSGLSSYALTSALSDHRFSPITKDELGTLEASVTLLTDFETASDAMDWEVGVHGVRISFFARNKRFGACYLPDVAVCSHSTPFYIIPYLQTISPSPNPQKPKSHFHSFCASLIAEMIWYGTL